MIQSGENFNCWKSYPFQCKLHSIIEYHLLLSPFDIPNIFLCDLSISHLTCLSCISLTIIFRELQSILENGIPSHMTRIRLIESNTFHITPSRPLFKKQSHILIMMRMSHGDTTNFIFRKREKSICFSSYFKNKNGVQSIIQLKRC